MPKGDPMMLRVLSTLNEAQARWYVAREVLEMGRGGLKAMHAMTGMSRPTILKGINELREGTRLSRLKEAGRVRQPGGGRKRLEESAPDFAKDLQRLLDENTAGDPMSHLRWTNMSMERIVEELAERGHAVSDETVRRRLLAMEYSLQGNRKSIEDGSGPERDGQFRYINKLVRQFIRMGAPVLSIDAKKKERVVSGDEKARDSGDLHAFSAIGGGAGRRDGDSVRSPRCLKAQVAP